jgi:hypothetical protein
MSQLDASDDDNIRGVIFAQIEIVGISVRNIDRNSVDFSTKKRTRNGRMGHLLIDLIQRNISTGKLEDLVVLGTDELSPKNLLNEWIKISLFINGAQIVPNQVRRTS